MYNGNFNYLQNSNQTMTIPNYAQNERLSEKIMAEAYLVNMREEVKLQAWRIKLWEKAQFQMRLREQKRAEYEDITILDNGCICVQTKNLGIDSCPRKVTDMVGPQLSELYRLKNPDEKILQIDCKVQGDDKQIYLRFDKIHRGSYILGKFYAAGVGVMAPTKAKTEMYAKQILLFLIGQVSERYPIADEPGWMEVAENQWLFFEEEYPIWETFMNKAR